MLSNVVARLSILCATARSFSGDGADLHLARQSTRQGFFVFKIIIVVGYHLTARRCLGLSHHSWIVVVVAVGCFVVAVSTNNTIRMFARCWSC